MLFAIYLSPSSAESINVISNPGFELGTADWTFYTNGAGTFLNDAPGAATPKAGHITITKQGSNVQLFQNGVALEPNTKYQLTFKAYSKTGHDLAVSMKKHSYPYTGYGLTNKVVNLGTTWGSHSITFTTSGFSGAVNNARLMFVMAPYDAAGDQYYFDNVILTKVSSGTPTPTPTPTPPLIPSSTISNPGFESGTAYWTFYTNGAGTFLNDASGAGTPHAGHITITKPGTNVQLFQNGVALEPNTKYQLTFKAYSKTGHDLAVSMKKHSYPYTSYGLTNKVVNLGTSWGSHSITFTTSGFSGTVKDARLMFVMAPYDATGDQYYFDDVILTKGSSVTPTPAPTPLPTATPSPPTLPPSNKQLVLLDVTHTHSTQVSYVKLARVDDTGKIYTKSGQGFSKFNFAPGFPTGSLKSPINYAGGTLYQRIKVYSKPSSYPVRYQVCVFQDHITSDKHACSSSSKLTFTRPGTYYASQSMTSLFNYGGIDWNRQLLVAMTVVKDKYGTPVDNTYSQFTNKWYGAPNLGLYYPMNVRYTAIIVPPGGGAPVWP
ncbi:MAG: carbohydrate binding domain-containing protein [ANME-2 cluster archaeon]|nr:carbohydrate binding domain-containing protein [ANME-2 cluster archaeon]